MDYQSLIEEVYQEIQEMELSGDLADYIPELASVDREAFGVSMVDTSGKTFQTGQYDQPFSIQSISKVHTLVMAYRKLDQFLWNRVNVEPSGNPFNHLAQLEYEAGIPRNPFINAGALVITDVLMTLHPESKHAILDFVSGLCGDPAVGSNPIVQASEMKFGSRNRALAHLLQSYDNLQNDVETLMDVYTYHCSIEMNCEQLAKSFLFLANDGYCIYGNKSIINQSLTKRINALMLTCGFYDEAGEFAFRVGLAGKSGVGGGVAAILPGKFSIAVYSPELNKKGNPVKAMHFLELLTTRMGISLF